MAPSGKTYSTAPSTSLAMGLSTNFGATPTNSAVVLHGPSTTPVPGPVAGAPDQASSGHSAGSRRIGRPRRSRATCSTTPASVGSMAVSQMEGPILDTRTVTGAGRRSVPTRTPSKRARPPGGSCAGRPPEDRRGDHRRPVDHEEVRFRPGEREVANPIARHDVPMEGGEIRGRMDGQQTGRGRDLEPSDPTVRSDLEQERPDDPSASREELPPASAAPPVGDGPGDRLAGRESAGAGHPNEPGHQSDQTSAARRATASSSPASAGATRPRTWTPSPR